ncbi:monovalent cation/proton antiporter, MnhG/PhaG subunit [Corallococcus coralloides DSM 2259]|uniref:Monovalent cation/proton antiporter, MnhG/PhaG subunit n=1 Tax=Corallococcus coralloides (strain ATCC 25202 / DSM 2259 / NBRC 100086 / M2) TaxID=1144275 RepID=H8MY31_CORCM|nr:monovalent cation/H(+) antiporter subunit G [Corallococcus coralloides]AFE07869.1 monovalent cation/proton antiporter, MnhG/PhaG subunit [Corallococcus coralloides DSM 2259]
MMSTGVQWVSNGLVALGLLFITAAIIGMYRLPSVLTRVHAAGAVPFGGALVIIGATLATEDGWLLLRGLLVAAFLMLTIPSSAHAIAWLSEKRPELAHDKARRRQHGPEGSERQ